MVFYTFFRKCYLLLSTTKKFGRLCLSSSPTPPSKNPVQVSCEQNNIYTIIASNASEEAPTTPLHNFARNLKTLEYTV